MAEQTTTSTTESPSADAEHEMAAAVARLRRDVPDGMDELMPLVYAELRRMAHGQLAAERPGHTLSTTALVHETYLRLAGRTRVECETRAQFFGLAARAMRHVLVDYARRHHAARRGGPARRTISLDDVEVAGDADALSLATRSDALLALDEALERLAAVDARAARVVECRFFGGLTESETAEVLGVSPRTVAGDWRMARGWLYRALRPEG